MVTKIEISDENLVEAINGLKLLPEELRKVRRNAQSKAGKAARSLSKKSFRLRTGVRVVRLAKRRTRGKGPRAWLGGSSVPVKHIAGLVKVRRGKRSSINSKKRINKDGESVDVQYIGEKIFIKNEYHPEYFTLNVPGRPVYMRTGKGKNDITAVKQDIAEQTYQAAEDVIPQVRQILQDEFLRLANEQIGLMSGKGFAASKSRVEDRLSGIKFIRTNIR